MRRYVVAANWKMNKDISSGVVLADEVKKKIEAKNLAEKVDVVLCPPFILLDKIRSLIEDSFIGLGAQNMYHQNNGAYTGEISASMLRTLSCTHVILGHSERRTFFGETDSFINKKVHKALENYLVPIICVGETLEQRNAGITFSVVENQMKGVLEGLSYNQMLRVVIAYEPVWAIGTGLNATPGQAQEVHHFIRKLVTTLYDSIITEKLPIQYGGSLKAENAKEIFSQPDVDGGLVGGASLVADQFVAIVEAAYQLSK